MKSRRPCVYLAVFLILALLGGVFMLFTSNPNLAYAESDKIAQAVDKEIVSANTGFSLRILKELQQEQKGKNIFISPLSISLALAMAYNGANATTKEAMAKTLGLEGMGDEKINSGFRDLVESLKNADSSVTLSIGDSTWIRSSLVPQVNPGFTKVLESYFGSSVYSRNFDDPKTITEINSWVSSQTNGKIGKIIDQIDSEMVMFLINAIYFKGDWTKQFDVSKTKPGDFTTPSGNVVKTDMMQSEGNYSYYADDKVQVVRLPYGRDKIAMYVFLPREGVYLDQFLQGFDENDLNSCLKKLSSSQLELQLPKLQLEYGKVDLKDALTKMGMRVAFDRNAADFSGIANVRPENLYIAFVDHKAVIDVNEKGSEAAAVTNVGIGVTSVPVQVPFIVDRPYLFVIRDDRSGSILFMGKIIDPTQRASP